MFRSLLDLSENQSFVVIDFHKFGNKVITQNNNIITHDAFVRVDVSIHESAVVAWTIIVKIMIDTDSEAIIIYGLYLSSLDQALAHKIIGRRGRTHGARIVSTQAKNEIIKRVMRVNNDYKIVL